MSLFDNEKQKMYLLMQFSNFLVKPKDNYVLVCLISVFLIIDVKSSVA